MIYIMLILLIACLSAIGVINYRHTCNAASKLIGMLKNG